MDYPFISKNNQPIVPGNKICYHSRRYGEVFGEVEKCIIKRYYRWISDPVKGYKRVATEPVARITAYVQAKAEGDHYPHGYTTTINPKSVILII